MGPICSAYPHLIIFIPIKNQLLVQLLFKPNNVTSELPLLKCQSCSRSQPSEKYSFCFGIISATTTENDKYIQILETANQEILVKIQMSPRFQAYQPFFPRLAPKPSALRRGMAQVTWQVSVRAESFPAVFQRPSCALYYF